MKARIFLISAVLFTTIYSFGQSLPQRSIDVKEFLKSTDVKVDSTRHLKNDSKLVYKSDSFVQTTILINNQNDSFIVDYGNKGNSNFLFDSDSSILFKVTNYLGLESSVWIVLYEKRTLKREILGYEPYYLNKDMNFIVCTSEAANFLNGSKLNSKTKRKFEIIKENGRKNGKLFIQTKMVLT